jgi:hypothetical protein
VVIGIAAQIENDYGANQKLFFLFTIAIAKVDFLSVD